MKRLAILNLALVIYLSGLICTIGVGYGFGAIVTISASLVILCLYLFEVYNYYRAGKLFSLDILVYSIALIVIGELFIQGYSISIGRSLFGLPGFYQLHAVVGFILLGLCAGYSIKYVREIESDKSQNLIIVFVVIGTVISVIGYLGFAGIFRGTVRFIYYSFVLLVFFYFAYFLLARFKNLSNINYRKAATLISLLMLCFWIVRWQLPEFISPGVYRNILHLGFVVVIVLPLSIILFKRMHYLTIFILYTVLTEIYFIPFNLDFKYLVNTGIHGCVGYENEVQYPIVKDPGIALKELFSTPTTEEIEEIKNDWKSKTFRPKGVQIEYTHREPNGDSIKVISHLVNGQRHYGLIRIPSGLNIEDAPILLALHGGGAETDVLDSDFVYRIASGMCRDILNDYIVIAPSFRGDIVRGKEFCFRSGGYTGDVWSGAAEDAASFLEVVKSMYDQNKNRSVIAMGISRGATVSLILGGLTDKIHKIIAISTHTDFMDEEAFRNERVGSDYPKIFFTPATSPDKIRKRLISSSPYYFAEHLPSFEIHQGTEDVLTAVQHTKHLDGRLKQLNRSDSTYKIYYYEGKGHGYDNDEVVCKSLREFAKKVNVKKKP
jgi:hypothetical protein